MLSNHEFEVFDLLPSCRVSQGLSFPLARLLYRPAQD